MLITVLFFWCFHGRVKLLTLDGRNMGVEISNFSARFFPVYSLAVACKFLFFPPSSFSGQLHFFTFLSPLLKMHHFDKCWVANSCLA